MFITALVQGGASQTAINAVNQYTLTNCGPPPS
jgi:hypothetical protein